MDPLTHALTSYSLKRAALPRASSAVTIAILLAGTLPDIDNLSAYFGPSAFLTFHRTACHSFLAVLLFAALATLPFLLLNRRSPEKQTSLPTVFFAALAAGVVHLLMDLSQSEGVQILWPFSPRRFAADWLPHVELTILGILLAGILLPKLIGLVTDEIGAKSKSPRGKLGATISLAAILLYIGMRFILHGNALATLESRTYRGEIPRRLAAFAESGSPFRWHGIVETESALHGVEVNLASGAEFDPQRAITSYKPAPSPALDAARNTPVARQFLQVARFPKATVEKTTTGFRVTLRTFPYTRDASSGRHVEALIDTDPAGKVLSQELVWAPRSKDFWLK